jgi:hypothetical protein
MNNEIMEQAIKAAVVSSLAAIKEDVLKQLVDNVINRKVNKRTGNDDGYSSDRVSYIDFMFGEQMELIAREAVREFVTENAEGMKEKIKESLQKSDGLLDKLSKNITETLACDWRIDIKFGDR